ncbi:AtpZ/AtpI family protein [Solirhodobacter olei]|uniref:AtpZ/AtpI family protein n=1 Tax=Solirhodobacter olei TaxID=2493082 RepID=UPI000FDC8F5B|nr:AtpZ/AtpI family protein [Solirhodobacter olei]
MAEPDDDERLRRLDQRIAKAKKSFRPRRRRQAQGISQAGVAWQMIVELVTGLLIGFGIGWGLDWLFGTMPVFLVLFTLLGFGAGVNVMLGTARDMSKKAAENAVAGDEGDESG